jgi:Arc/MetJ-type ribon-helix-helix transcriptional regulator
MSNDAGEAVPGGRDRKAHPQRGVVDLGRIDLLVQEGFYSNRSDFIRTAIRNLLVAHADEVRTTVARRTLLLGLQSYSRADLEQAVAAGQQLHIHVVGLARIARTSPPSSRAPRSNRSRSSARSMPVPRFARRSRIAFAEAILRRKHRLINHDAKPVDRRDSSTQAAFSRRSSRRSRARDSTRASDR